MGHVTPRAGGGRTGGRLALRPAEEVMELERLGAVWPTKFSFSHSFVRTAARLGFSCRVAENSLDEAGRGRIVYRVEVGGATLTFAVFSTPIAEAEQEDRIIARRWDATAALFMGVPSEDDLCQSRDQLPVVVWGRSAPNTVTWSRANRSARLFDHVVGRLAAGRQPDPRLLNQVGYLIRTTGFSGNGRNGMVDFAQLRAMGHPLSAPYHVQLLVAYLWREFGFDLATHLARIRNPKAADLAPDIRRFVGVGNSSGIGLAPFVVRHPRLIDRWVHCRETALAELHSAGIGAADPRLARLADDLNGAVAYFRQEPRGDLDEFTPGRVIAADLVQAANILDELRRDPAAAGEGAGNVIAALTARARLDLTVEAQELLNAFLLEIHDGGGVDPHALVADESLSCPPHIRTGVLLALIRERFAWAARYGDPEGKTRPYFWYASEENMEPRRGRRGVDEGERHALPVDILGQLARLVAALERFPAEDSVGRFVGLHPQLRYMTMWAYSLAADDYAVARMDLLGADFSPLKIMRFQLATYGMLKFRPRSKTWLRATLLQGAGLPEELAAGNAGAGLLPEIPTVGGDTETDTETDTEVRLE